MRSRRFRSLLVLAFVFNVRLVGAQTCNLNPSGPDQLTVVVQGDGTDFDFGWKSISHDYQVQEGRFEVCLNNCDGSADPVCDVQGNAGQHAVEGRAFLQPLPLVVGSAAACAITTFREPFATGTANVQTGDIDVMAAFSFDVYVTSVGSQAPVNVCPRCSGVNAGDPGTCTGGATPGAPCTTSGVVDVSDAADNPYQLSRDCLPAGTPQTTQFTMHVASGEARIDGRCPGQVADNDCGGGTCTAACDGFGRGGVRQSCCSSDPSASCFATPVVRSGVAFPGAPAWPSPSYPKGGAGRIVGTFCMPASPFGPVVNNAVGLPGPAAFVFPIDATWSLDPSPVPCTADAQCADGDLCTHDVCNLAAGTCSNPPVAGVALAECALEQVVPAEICGADPIDPSLQAVITTAIAKARAALQKVEGVAPKKQKKLRKSAKNALKPIVAKAIKAAKKKTLTGGCRDAIKALVSNLQTAISG